MPAPASFPLVRGHAMRVTALDACGVPDYGADNMAVSEGFVQVALTARTNEPEAITVTNARGATCVSDPGVPEFLGYSAEITFCDVTPCLFALVTGQPVVLDAAAAVAGFRMNTGVNLAATAFALEVWTGVPGVACSGAAGAYGYLLLPFLSAGIIGDFTIENAAITFTLTGAVTKDGTGWDVGPYNVVRNAADSADAPLPLALDAQDHLYAVYTTVAPPAPTDGCDALVDPSPSAPGETTPVAQQRAARRANSTAGDDDA